MELDDRKQVNLRVLKRHDAQVVDIVDTCCHAVVYAFNNDNGTWVISPLPLLSLASVQLMYNNRQEKE